LVKLFKGDNKAAVEKIRKAVNGNVPHADIRAFPTNLCLVVYATQADKENVEAHLAKLREAKHLLESIDAEVIPPPAKR
jgi:hypothetical protein